MGGYGASTLLIAGTPAILHYDLTRLTTCRATYEGGDAWSLIASWQIDGGVVDSASVTQFANGSPTLIQKDVNFIIPAASDLAFWFHNFDITGCSAWDSLYGSNFHFIVDAGGAATVRFRPDWSVTQVGTIVGGGELLVDYDILRLPNCRALINEQPAWAVTGYIILDGGPAQTFAVTEPLDSDLVSAPARLAIPAGTHSIQLYFDNGDVTGCHSWDSNYGNNYSFSVD
jgi:hypothetical protein